MAQHRTSLMEPPDVNHLEPAAAEIPAVAGHARKPWSWMGLLVFAGLALVAFVLASLLAFGGYALLSRLFGWHETVLTVAEDPLFSLALQLVFYILLLA